MRDDPSVIALVARVGDGDQEAWNELVERYAPLVWSICVRYQLSRQDIDDVGQSVWLLLVERSGSSAASDLLGWLATTTRRECLRILRAGRRYDHEGLPPDDQMPPDPSATMIEQEIIVAERNAALRAAFAELPQPCRELLSMLMSDPSPAYAEISARLGMAVGSSARPGPAAWNGCAVHRTWSPSSAIRRGTILRLRSQGVSKVTRGWDDEEVLAALQQALRAERAVPPNSSRLGRTPSPGTTLTPNSRSSPTTPPSIPPWS